MHFWMKCDPNHSICMIQWLAIKYMRVLCVRVCVFVWKCIHFGLHIIFKIMENFASFAFSLVWEWRIYCDILWQWYCCEYICIAFFSHSDSLCYGMSLCSNTYFWTERWCYLVHDFHIILRTPCIRIIFCTTIYTRTKLYSCVYILYLRRLHNAI